MALEREDRDAIVLAIRDGFAATQNQSRTTPNRSSTPTSNNRLDSAAGGLATIFNKAGGNVTDFTKTTAGATIGLGLFGSGLTNAMGYLEDTNNMYRALSKIGAGFNGSLGELRLGAAQTGMTLDQFGSLVSQNSVQLSGFADGVEGGVKQFRRLSNAMLTGEVGEQMLNLGFSLEESNDFLAKNMELTRRRARLQGLTGRAADDAQLAASLEMAESLSVMAKLSGKQLDQMQDDIIERQREGATQAKIRLLEQQGVAGAGKALDDALVSLQGAPAVAKDLLADLVQTGVPMSEATRNFAATNREAYAALVQQANAIKRGDAESAAAQGARATAAAAEYANSTQGLTLATLQQVSSVAAGQAKVLEEVSPLIDAINANADRMREATGRTPTILESFNDMLAQQTARTRTTAAGAGADQGLSRMMNEAELALRQSASRVNESLANNMTQNEAIQNSLEGILTALNGAVRTQEGIAQIAVNAIPGQTPDQSQDPWQMSQAQASALAEANEATPGSQERTEALRKLGDIVQDGALQAEIVRIDLEKLEQFNVREGNVTPVDRAIGGNINAGDVYRVGEQGPETMVAGLDGAIIPNMKSMLNRMPDIAKRMQEEMANIRSPMSQAAQQVAAMSGMNSADISDLLQQAQTTNELLSRLLGVNTTQMRTGEKHLRSTRSAGNLMNGIGRA